MKLTHIDLFSGIGGFSLVAGWAGFKTVVFCEKDEYCQKVLKKHWPDVPIVSEIRDFKWPLADTENIGHTTNRQHWGKGIGAGSIETSVTLLTGGFPCQPFSVAGKRRGKEDDRYLWPEMFRVISEVRPTWILAENVAGIVKMALDDCLSDLESEGYETEAFIIPACAVNAPHRRDRVWIVAHFDINGKGKRYYGKAISENDREIPERRNSENTENKESHLDDGSQDVADNERNRRDCKAQQELDGETSQRKSGCGFNNGSQDVADAERVLSQRHQYGQGQGEFRGESWWDIEPDVGRVAHGIPNRVDRLKALGNAIVPQVAYEIIKEIAAIERQNEA